MAEVGLLDRVRRVVAEARPVVRSLVLYEVLFKAVSVTLILPIVGWSLRSLAGVRPDFLFSNEEIALFLLSPRGAIAGISLAAVTLGLLFLEQAGLMMIAGTARAGRPLRAEESLLLAFRSSGRIFSMAFAQVLRSLPFLLPFLVLLPLIYLWLLSGHDINYYLAAKPPEWTLALALAGVIVAIVAALLLWLAVRWAFAVPICLVGDESGFGALRSSQAIVGGGFRKVAVTLGGWLVVGFGASALILLTVGGLGDLLIGQLTVAPNLAVLVVGLFALILAAVAILESFVLIVVYSFIVTDLFLEMGSGSSHFQGDFGAVPDVFKLLRLDRVRPWMLWTGAALVLAVSTVASVHAIEGMDLMRDVQVSAHRGASGNAPENTLAAIERAIEEGADYAEIDVQETSDGVVVLLHDTDLMKVAGDPRQIHAVTLEELQSIDVGSLFSPEFAGERVPTLAEAIELSRGRIKLNIELKFTSEAQALVERVVGLLEETQTRDAVLMSLSLDGVLEVREYTQAYPLGHLVSAAVGDVTKSPVDFLALGQAKVNERIVRSAHRVGKQVYAWTVNTPEDMLSMVLLGVDNLITDYPAVAVELLDERSEWSDVELLALKLHHRLKK